MNPSNQTTRRLLTRECALRIVPWFLFAWLSSHDFKLWLFSIIPNYYGVG